MLFQDVLVPAIQFVLDLDFPDDACSQAVNDCAGRLAGIDPEEVGCHFDD